MARAGLAMLAALAVAGCSTMTGSTVDAPYIARMKPVPEGQHRIYLTGSIPARLHIREDCVLFENLGGYLILPVFEATVTAGRDAYGPWVHDATTNVYFRDGDRVLAGGGESDSGLDALKKRRVLQERVPDRCKAAMTRDSVPVIIPGMERPEP